MDLFLFYCIANKDASIFNLRTWTYMCTHIYNTETCTHAVCLMAFISILAPFTV